MLNPCKNCLVLIKCEKECGKFKVFIDRLEIFAQMLMALFILLKFSFVTHLCIHYLNQVDEYIVLILSWGMISFICNRIVDYRMDEYNSENYGGKLLSYIIVYLFPESIMFAMMITNVIYEIQKPYFRGGDDLEIW